MIFSFVGTIASWITADWELKERVLESRPILYKEHEGECAGRGFVKALSEFNIVQKISSTQSYLTDMIVSLPHDHFNG